MLLNIQKLEKIASAIYLITSFFDDKEPLKWRLRTLSTEIVSNNVRDKSSLIKEVASLCGLAKTSGLISDANYSILDKELLSLIGEFEKPLNADFFYDFSESTPVERQLTSVAESQGLKDKDLLPYPVKPPVKPVDKPALKDFGVVSVKKNSRQSTIIGLLKRKKEIMIKDVSPLISGCSEKTIQRELLSMVASGILKKVGEKRWSRYSLA